MKTGRETSSTKRYQVVFSKLQAGVFMTLLLALLAASFSFGYLLAERGAAGGAADGGSGRAVFSPPGQGEEAGRGVVVVLGAGSEGEARRRPVDAIEPKFYRELLRADGKSGEPMEPIKLPEVKKAPKPAPPPPEAVEGEPPAAAGAPPGKRAAADALAARPEKRKEAPPRAPKPWTAGSGYTVQIVSVRKFDEALRTVQRLRRAGFRPYIKSVDLGARGRWYRVRVGHYGEREEARKALSEIRGRARIRGGRIVSI